MKQLLQNNLVYFWLDELEFYIKSTDIKLNIDETKSIFYYQKDISFSSFDLIFDFEAIDEDNSSSANINIQWIDFTYSIQNHNDFKKSYIFQFVVNWKIKNWFQILIQNKKNNSKSKLILYSDFFELIDNKKINYHNFLKNFLVDYKSFNLKNIKLKKSENVIWDIEISWVNFHYEKIKPAWFDKWYKFSFIFENHIINAFSINFANDTYNTSWKHVFLIYSQILTLHYRWLLSFNLLSMVKNFVHTWFIDYRRLDIASDLNVSKWEIIKFFKPFSSKIKLEKTTWFYQTYYTRDIKNETNRLHTIRIYDKKLDSFKKEKLFLYNHLCYYHVNRVEIEIRSDEAQTIKNTLDDILNNKELLKNIFILYLNRDLFKKYQINDFNSKLIKLPKENKESELYENYLKLWYIPKRFMSQANWYAKNILNQTWRDWFMQYMFWFFPDDEKTQVHNINGKIVRFDIQRQPEELIDAMFIFMKDRLLMPQRKINSIIKNLTNSHYNTKIILNSNK